MLSEMEQDKQLSDSDKATPTPPTGRLLLGTERSTATPCVNYERCKGAARPVGQKHNKLCGNCFELLRCQSEGCSALATTTYKGKKVCKRHNKVKQCEEPKAAPSGGTAVEASTPHQQSVLAFVMMMLRCRTGQTAQRFGRGRTIGWHRSRGINASPAVCPRIRHDDAALSVYRRDHDACCSGWTDCVYALRDGTGQTA